MSAPVKLREFYHHTSHLSKMFETMDRGLYIEVHEQIEHYASEYDRLCKSEDPISTAHAFNLLIQEAIDKVTGLKDGPPISCGKGCNACCSLHIDITSHEAQLLIAISLQNGISIDWERVSRQAGLDIDKWDTLSPADRRCAFLSDAGSCLVYEHRPASCRKAMVTGDPDLCDMVKYPKGKVQWAVSGKAEILASSVLNATESGNMADMLIKNKLG